MINIETGRERERERETTLKKIQFIHRRFYTASDITVKSVCILTEGRGACVCFLRVVWSVGGGGAPTEEGRRLSPVEWRYVWVGKAGR